MQHDSTQCGVEAKTSRKRKQLTEREREREGEREREREREAYRVNAIGGVAAHRVGRDAQPAGDNIVARVRV